MSRFDQCFARGAEMMAVNNGRTIVYRPREGNPVTLTQAMVTQVDVREVDSEEGRRLRRAVQVTISANPAAPGGGVANPTKLDVVEIDGERWSIESLTQSANLVTLECVDVGLMELARPGFRRS